VRTFRLTLIAALLVAACAAPAADATLPKFKDTTIVLGKSIGGVKLGASAAAVKKAWGSAGAQFGQTSRLFRVKGDTNGTSGEGAVAYTGNKVSSVSLTAPVGAKGRIYKAPFTTPRTSKGIGLGSSVAKLLKAYPKVKETKGSTYITVPGTGRISTTIQFNADDRRIFMITIEILPAD